MIASAVINPARTTAGDAYGHGTHVAGIIAGNARRYKHDEPYGRYVGTAPDANLIAIKAADENGDATVLDVIYGIQFAIDHKADYNIRVLNLSLQSTIAESYKTDPLDAAVEAAWFSGIVVVAAAGNLGTAADAVNYAPGNDPYVISVGGVDDQGTGRRRRRVADWSSRGTTQDGFAKPELSAPGAHIVSTLSPGQRVRLDVPDLHRRRQLHPGRRHLDGRADRRRRRGRHRSSPPRLDARPGQGRDDHDAAHLEKHDGVGADNVLTAARRRQGRQAQRGQPRPRPTRV